MASANIIIDNKAVNVKSRVYLKTVFLRTLWSVSGTGRILPAVVVANKLLKVLEIFVEMRGGSTACKRFGELVSEVFVDIIVVISIKHNLRARRKVPAFVVVVRIVVVVQKNGILRFIQVDRIQRSSRQVFPSQLKYCNRASVCRRLILYLTERKLAGRVISSGVAGACA